MSQFCSNCSVNIADDEQYKVHYKGPWHQYNIKRKLLNLQPVDEQTYLAKFQSQQDALKGSYSTTSVAHFCKVCNKSFATDKTYDQHLQSSNHKDKLKLSLKQPQDIQSDKQSQISKCSLESPNICLFCDQEQDGIQECVRHMEIQHGFFIREQECVVNLPGLLRALSEQINKNQTCLHCYQTFKSAQAAKSHMLDKGHCFMPQQQYKVLSKYYDFEEKLQTLINDQKQLLGLENGTQSKQKQIQQEQPNPEDQQKDEDNQDWEDEELDEDDQDFEDIDDNLPEDEKDLLKKKRLQEQLKELKQFKATLMSTGELQLPNGKILGSRLLRKYYKQNHIPLPNPEQKMIEQAKQEFQAIQEAGQANGEITLFHDLPAFEKFLSKQIDRITHQQKRLDFRTNMRQNQIQRRWLRQQC